MAEQQQRQELPVLNVGPSAAYVQAQKEYRNAQVNANKLLEDLLGQETRTREELKRQEIASGEADAEGKLAEQRRAQEIADAAKEVQARFGGNARDPHSLASELALKIREESAVAREQLAAIRQRASISVLDDPLQFLLNAIELPQVAADYNTRASQVDAMNAELTRIENRVKEQTQLAHATIPTITTEQAAAAAKKATAEAAKRAGAQDLALITSKMQYSQQALANIYQNVIAESNMSSQQQSAAIANFNSRMEAIKFAESATRREAETAFAMEKLTDLKAKKQAIAVAAAAYGHDPAKFTLSMFERLPAQQQLRFMSGALSGTYGADIYDAWKNVNTFGGPQLPDSTKKWQEHIAATIEAIKADASKNPQEFEKFEKDKDTYIAGKLRERMNQLKNLPSTEAMAFLKELPPAAMAQSFSNFEKTPVGTVLGPLLTLETSPSTETVLDTIAKGLAAKGVPTTGQAYAIAQYYINNIKERNRNGNAAAYKIELPSTYKVMLTINPNGRTASYDLTKPEQVQMYLLYKYGQVGKPISSEREPFIESIFPGSTKPFPGSRQERIEREAQAAPPTFSNFRNYEDRQP